MKKFYSFRTQIVFALTSIMISTIGLSQVTVNATGGLATASYTTLRNAFIAINAGTHTGTIAIGISTNTTETGPCILNGSGAGAANYTAIGIAPTVDGITVSGVSNSGHGIIELNGADNVIIDGDNPNTAGTNRDLTIRNTAAITVGFTSCIRLATSTLIPSCNSDIIRNLNLSGSGVGRNTAAYTTEVVSWGVIASGGASTVLNTTAPNALSSAIVSLPAGQTLTSLTISNNNIQTVSRGISVNGSSVTVAPSLMISNNTIGNPTIGAVDQVTAIGITAQGTSSGTISGNLVRIEGYISSSTPINRGINVGLISIAGVSGMIIEKNNIERDYNNHVNTRAAIGIDISGGNNHIIRNNFVGQCLNSQIAGNGAFTTNKGVAGIRILGGTGHHVYHNTVHLTGAIVGTTGKNLIAAFEVTSLTSTGMDVRNNIFSNQITGGNPTLYNTFLVSMFLPSGGTSAMNLTLNNNTYYQGTLAQSGIAQIGATGSAANLYKSVNFNASITTPANNLRSYTNTLSVGTNDNASYASSNGTPVIAPTDLHISFASSEFPNVDQKGAVSVGVLTDIDGDTRPSASTTNPDIGADEFIVPTCFAASGGTITPSTFSSCAGQTVNLISVGATNALGITYQWKISSTPGGPYSNVSGGTGANTVSFTTPSLTIGTNYYVLQTTCSFGPLTGLSNEITLTVNSLPIVTVSGSSSFCAGGSVTLIGTSGGTSQWYVNDSLIVGATSNTFAVTSAGSYNMIKTNITGCSDSAANGITVIVNSLPNVTSMAMPSAVCTGGSATLMGMGAISYVWTGSVNDNVSFTPASSATYTVTGTDLNGCTNTATQSVTVNPLPTVTAMAMPSAVCTGGSTTLMGIGATSYLWTGSVNDNVSFTPASSATYTVTGTDVNGCTNSATQSVTVNPIPVTTVNSQTICPSGTATLTAAGATTYSWSTGAIINPVNVTPLSTTSYTVTGTSLGCTSSAVAIVTVGSAIVASVNSSTICAGSIATLTAAGGTTYLWNMGSAINPLSVTPITTTSYTVTATSGTCTGTAVSTVTVNPLPSVSFTPFPTSFCNNAAAFSLSGGSPAGGIYSGTSVSGGMFDPSAAGMGMYLITYTISDINSCINTDTATATVDLCSGIFSSDISDDITIYPNPTNGMFNISIHNAKFSEIKISITDVQGKEVYNSVDPNITNEYKKEIGVANFAKGIYNIKLISANDVKVYKLIVQ